MEGVAPPLQCLLEIRLEIENGSSLREALVQYAKRSDGEFGHLLRDWLICLKRGQSTSEILGRCLFRHRKALLQTFEHGLDGHPIGERLNQLQQEMQEACDEQIKVSLQKLPVLSLLPLLFFQFPAFLLLLLGPLIMELQLMIGD